MSKRPTPPPAEGKPKRHGLELTKREGLALAFRRWSIREREKETEARAASEAKSEARHERALARREQTSKLALRRVKACQKHPSPHAIGQLAAIAQNLSLRGRPRVAAAVALLCMARFTSDLPKGVTDDLSEPPK